MHLRKLPALRAPACLRTSNAPGRPQILLPHALAGMARGCGGNLTMMGICKDTRVGMERGRNGKRWIGRKLPAVSASEGCPCFISHSPPLGAASSIQCQCHLCEHKRAPQPLCMHARTHAFDPVSKFSTPTSSFRNAQSQDTKEKKG